MAYVSILVPFVIAYIFYAWRSIDKKKIDAEEMDEGGHAYWVDSYSIDSGQLTIDSYYAAWPHNPFLSEKDVLQGRRSVLS